VLGGRLTAGLTDDQLTHLATAPVAKCSARDLPVAVAKGLDGATTVAGTLAVARAAGIEIMATGGLGGVHREAQLTRDVSADLGALAAFPGLVVAAGVKSVLDIPATLEQLETLGVTVLGWRTRQFPGFYLTDSGVTVDWQVDSVEEVADIVRARRSVPGAGGIFLANPLPAAVALDPAVHDQALSSLVAQMAAQGVSGKQVTPFLLAGLAEATGGRSVTVNETLVLANAALAGRIARALASA
jgi:pseudouridine-5'-phosphate glycosidase